MPPGIALQLAALAEPSGGEGELLVALARHGVNLPEGRPEIDCFKRVGWFYLPFLISDMVWLVVLFFCLTVFRAVDRHSHSVADTLYGVFPFALSCWLIGSALGRAGRTPVTCRFKSSRTSGLEVRATFNLGALQGSTAVGSVDGLAQASRPFVDDLFNAGGIPPISDIGLA